MTITAHDRAAGHASAATRAIRILGLAAATVTSVLAASGGAWPDAANWPRSIAIGTGSPGGIYYGYGEGLGRILTRTLHIETTAQ